MLALFELPVNMVTSYCWEFLTQLFKIFGVELD